MSEYSSYYSYGYDSYYDDLYDTWYGGSKSKKDKKGSSSGWSWGGYSKKYKSALGWGSSKFSDTVTTKYSSYSTYGGWEDTTSKKSKDAAGDVLNRAFREVRDFVVILDFPYKININISGKRETDHVGDYKNGVYIFIPTAGLFDGKSDKKIVENAENIMKIFCGFGAHEASHLKYTSKKVLDSFLQDVKYSGSKPEIQRRILKVITNIVEDERVEDRLLNDRPGYCDFIAASKEHQYSLYKKSTDEIDSELKGAGTEPTKADQFFRNLINFIRFPNKANPDILKEFGGYYKQIRSYINPFPESTKEVCEAATSICKVAEEVFEKYGHPRLKEVDTADTKVGRVCLGGFDIDPSKGNASEVFGSINKEDVDKIASSELVQKLASGEIEKGAKDGAYFESVKGHKDYYNYLADEVSKYVPQIRNLLKNIDKN